MSRSLDAIILEDIYSLREIQRMTGRARTTIIRHRRKLRKQLPDTYGPHVPPDAPGDNQLALPDVISDVKLGDAPLPTSSHACEPYRDVILQMVAANCNAMSIWRELVERYSVPFGYQSVKRYIAKLRPVREVFNRIETPMSFESQSDYGLGAPTFNADTGKFQRPRLFCLSLSYSRHFFAKVVWKSSQKVWCELHEAAFQFLGGSTATLKIDNLKEGVAKIDAYEPQLNPLFESCMAHYGVAVICCHPFSPNQKGKIESVIGYVQRALEGKRFDNIGEQNAYLLHWIKKYAFEREHGTTKRIVREAYAEELPHLQRLPLKRFEYYERFDRRVGIDGFVEIQRAYYLVPKHYASTTVIVHMTDLWVRIIDPKNHQLIREHPRAQRKGHRSAHPIDLPKVTPPAVLGLVDRAKELSKDIGQFAERVEKTRGHEAARALLGLVRLSQKYRVHDLDMACQYANTAHSTRIALLRDYLERYAPPPSAPSNKGITLDIQRYNDHFRELTRGEGL